MQRFLDLVVLSVTAPIWLVALMVASCVTLIDTGRPVLFKQQRIGHMGLPFTIYKIRTFKDGETTKISRAIRSLGLDEIPQAYNVIKGDMSLVGPRPELVELQYVFHRPALRHSVRPGVTGLWQVAASHDDIPINEAFDLVWVACKSLKGYFILLALTPWVLIGGRVDPQKLVDTVTRGKEHEMQALQV